jgi:acetyltransferase
LAADTLIEGSGSLANLSDQTIETLNNLLPPFWSRSNPVDLVGDAKANQYAAAVDALIKDPNKPVARSPDRSDTLISINL